MADGDARHGRGARRAHRHLASPTSRPWLANQAAGGYVEYDAADRHLVDDTRSRRSRSPIPTARRSSPAACSWPLGVLRDVPAHRGPVPHRRRLRLARARRRAVRGHRAVLPARLRRQPGRRPGCPRSTASCPRSSAGADVVDVGCGHGASTILMAAGVPGAPRFLGIDYHEASITVARRRADRRRGRGPGRVRGRRRRPTCPPASADLVTMFDCLHDMGDPVGRRPRRAGGAAPPTAR